MLEKIVNESLESDICRLVFSGDGLDGDWDENTQAEVLEDAGIDPAFPHFGPGEVICTDCEGRFQFGQLRIVLVQALVNIDTLEHPLSHWKGKSGPGGAEKGNGYQLSTEKGKMLKEVENARDRKMPQHTSLNTKMLQSKNGESLGRIR